MAAEESIKVVVRVRKLLEREKEEKKVFKVQDSAEIYHESSKKTWTFDRVFGALEGNRAVYFDTVSSIIESAVSGFNATIFAYGQTSSGKTHTMMGTEEEPGVTKQAIEQLFYAVEETPDRCFLMMVSYLEIYNEQVMDLLDKSSTNLKLRENESGQVYVEGVKSIPVTCAEEVYKIMKDGEKNRHYAETKMNDRSSRSHTIFRIVLESINRLEETIDEEDDDGEGRQSMIAYLNLVDLAGSEKAGQTGAEGTRLKEGGNINKSLMMLGQVIQKLSSGDKNLYINYRDSKLTRLLQNSLGGNAKTAIICTITPALMSEDQTLSTLRFASQAKTIKTHATINEVLDDQAKMAKLKRELAEREKEKLELLRKVEELTNANQNGEQSRQTRELLEQLEAERTEKAEQLMQLQLERSEKAEQIAKNRWLQEKILVSSQPAKPSKKSLLLKDRNRRETWAAPRVSTVSRASFGFHAFSRPLSVFEQPSAQPTLEGIDDVFFAPRSSRKVKFLSPPQPSCSTLVEEDEDGVSPSLPLNSMSLDSSILDLSLGNGTPKAIIRDRYKRVSRQLTAREQELLRQERELKRVTMEYQELEEFARLESETGVHEDRFTSRLSTASYEDIERVKYLEKNFSDAETLNLELNKTLRETKLELESVSARYEIMKEKYDALCITEKELQEKWKLLEDGSRIQTEELKGLKERCRVLEGEHQDSDMKMELAVNRKETENKELRKVLECAYEEISVLERGDKTAVKERFDKIVNLQRKVQELEELVAGQSSLVCERNQLKEDLSKLQAGFTEVCDEMEQISEEKLKLEQEIKNFKTNSGAEQVGEMVGRIAELSEQVEKSEMRAENLELGNQSLLNTLDHLTRQQEEMRSRIEELSELSSRLENSNSEFQTEILQLRDELQMVRQERDKALQEKMKMEEEKTLNEEKSKNEAEGGEDMKIKQMMAENLDGIERAKMDLENEKEMLKELRSQLEEEQRKFEEEKASWEDGKLHQQIVQTSDATSINEKVEEEKKKWEEERKTLSDDMKILIKEKEALSEENEILIRKMETLSKEKTTLVEKNDGLSQEKKTLSEEKNRLLVEKETLSEEKKSLTEEKNSLTEEKNRLLVEKKTLSEEKNSLTEEKNRLLEEKKTLSEEKNSLTEEKNRLLVEKKTLFEEKISLIKEKETLFEENNSLDKEKKTLLQLLEEKNSLIEENELLFKEKTSLTEEKKSLVEENNCLIKEMETFSEQRNSLIEENKTLSEEKKTLTEEQTRLLEEIKVVEEKRQLCLEDLSKAEENISVITAESTDREIKISEHEDQFKILNAQIQEQDVQIQEQHAQIQELKAEILNHTASLENQNIKLQGKSSQILDLESKVDVLTSKLNKSEMLRSEVIAEQEQDREKIKKLVTANTNLESEIDLLRAEQGRENNSAKKKALATLNATLSNLEETLQTGLDETMAPNGEQTMNATIGNMTIGPGEMAEMRNQLLALQEQLIHFDFEDYETKKNENKKLIAEMSELKKKISYLEQSASRAAEVQEKIVDELTEKHRIQVSIISTKMREELNINLPALEDRIREEMNEKRASEVSQLKSLYEKEIADLKQAAGLSINKLNISTNHALVDTSFDETINLGTNQNFGGNQFALFQSGPGESLEVQMLRGELNTLREELEHKKSELEEFKQMEQIKTSTELGMGSPTDLDDANAKIVRLNETISNMESSPEPGKFEELALLGKDTSLDQSTDEIKILKRDLDAALAELRRINEERENCSLKSQTDANLDNLNESANNYSDLKEKFDNISEHLEMVKKENSELKYEIDELNSLKLQLESELAKVQEEFSALEIEHASVEESAEQVQQSAEQLIQTNEDLNSRVEDLEKTNIKLSQELSDCNNKMDEMRLEFEDVVSEQVDIVTYELTNTAEALKKEVEVLKLEKSTLEEDKLRLDSRINELEAVEVELKMLKDSEIELKEQIMLLQVTLNSTQTLLNDEKTSNEINMRSKVELETLKDLLQEEINNLQTKIDDLENQVVVQETLMDKLESEVDLRKELEIRVMENNKYITDLKKEVQRLQAVPKDTLRLGNNMEENEEDSELSVEEQLAQALKKIKILEETRMSAYKQYKEIEEIYEKECDKLEEERDQVKKEKERLAEELDETKKRFNETQVMIETMKDTSKHKHKTSSEEEEEEEEENLRDKLIKAEEDVKMYRRRIEAAMKNYQANEDFYEKECNKLESERDAARLEKTRLEEELKQVRSLPTGSSNTSPFSVCQSEEKTIIGNSDMDFTRVAGEGSETVSEVWREEKMRLENELKKMEEIKLNLEIEIQDLRKDVPVETKVELERLRKELEEQKKTCEKIQRENAEPSSQIQHPDQSEEVVALKSRLKEVMSKLGKKNAEYASLKVDVDREHLPYQIKNKQLEDELENEKRVVQRLTNDLRLMQTEKMDCTVVNTKPRVHSSSTNTSISGSPQWTSGSGTIKEIRLYELEHKTRRLEKENANLKLREEFYINKGSEWKGRAKRYEAILDENEIKYRKRSDDSKSEPAAATSAVKENVKPNELDDLDLGLNQERPRREYRLPADQRKRKENDCKTQ